MIIERWLSTFSHDRGSYFLHLALNFIFLISSCNIKLIHNYFIIELVLLPLKPDKLINAFVFRMNKEHYNQSIQL